jgi:glutathione S-transferase
VARCFDGDYAVNLPKLTLVSHALCPFVQRAAVVLAEKNVPFDRLNIDLVDKPAWFLALSPLGKVPLLRVRQEDGDEVILFESMVICEFLEESQEGPRLHPSDPLTRARHRAWIEFMSVLLADVWGFLNATEERTATAKSLALSDKLRRIENELSEEPYFAGASFSMVDAITAPVFRYFDVLDLEVAQPFFADLPRVSAWRKALAARPSVAAAVGANYGSLLRAHFAKQEALIAT